MSDEIVSDEIVRAALARWFGEESCEFSSLGNGHINDTWRVDTAIGCFVLQRLSQAVFADPERVMANQAQLFRAAGDGDFEYLLPQPLPARDGSQLVSTDETSYWRLCRYFADTRTLESLSNVVQARAAGEAFGRFQRLTQAIKPYDLQPVIDGFLELDGYWRSLVDNATTAREESRDARALQLFGELAQRLGRYRVVDAAARAVIHGDCKVNNLLFAASAERVVAILDLDTLMVGPWWLDFGDLVRSAAFTDDGAFLADRYAGLAEGFFTGRGSLHADEVIDALRAPLHLCFMLAVRFLDDHLSHDKYFKVAKHGDNLQRARAQFNQLVALEAEAPQSLMRDTLGGLVG